MISICEVVQPVVFTFWMLLLLLLCTGNGYGRCRLLRGVRPLSFIACKR